MVSSQNVVSRNVRTAMDLRGVTQKSLAEVLGITQQAMSMKLNGTRPLRIEELEEIAGYLEVDAASLLARSAS